MERSRNFCFTLNNYTIDEVETVKGWDCKYIIFGKEVGATGTQHLQGYVSFQNAKTLGALKKYSARAHWEIARGTPKQASEYCEKDGDVFEKGTRPLSQVEKGDGEKERWASALKAVEEGRLEDVDPQILCSHLKQIEYAVDRIAQNKRKIETLSGDFEHEWFVGPSGCGKSKRARDENPEAYIKDPQERWWDGYKQEEVVIIDDFDKFQVKQGGDMKRWSDRYAFRAPVKGGYMLVRPRKIIVTSQYRPDQIWTDEETLTAVNRRFNIVEWPLPPLVATFNLPRSLPSLNMNSNPPDPAGADRRLAGGGSDEVDREAGNEENTQPPDCDF